MLECVVNVSEGRDRTLVDALAAAAGSAVIDVHVDADHHRCVLTLAARDPDFTEEAARSLTRAVAAAPIDLEAHDGVHPRLGAIDVVPFVALGDTPPERAGQAALGYARWAGAELGLPVFLYDDADPAGRSLPDVRRDAFGSRAPDLGPPAPHPRLGAVAVGARPPLVAVNVELDTDDLAVARAIARSVRSRDGGLPGVRALGLPLASVHKVQVSMNLVDLPATGLEAACLAVSERAEASGVAPSRIELVGLIPQAEWERTSAAFRSRTGIGPDATVEGRVAALGSTP